MMAAFVGTGLGIYNLFVERSKRKVKVLVQPKAVMRRFRNTATGDEGVLTSLNEFNQEALDEYFAIEAVNLSSFPVTIHNVGFEVRKQNKRMMIVPPILADNGQWPRKLEQRESVTVYGLLLPIINDPGAPRIKNSFVETSCGTICRGTSGALKGLAEYANELQLGRRGAYIGGFTTDSVEKDHHSR